MPVNLKKPEFAPEVPPALSTRKWLVQEAKFNLKYYTGWNTNSYIYTLLLTTWKFWGQTPYSTINNQEVWGQTPYSTINNLDVLGADSILNY